MDGVRLAECPLGYTDVAVHRGKRYLDKAESNESPISIECCLLRESKMLAISLDSSLSSAA